MLRAEDEPSTNVCKARAHVLENTNHCQLECRDEMQHSIPWREVCQHVFAERSSLPDHSRDGLLLNTLPPVE